MPDEVESLTAEDIDILMTLWRHENQPLPPGEHRRPGLTRDEVAERLKTKYTKSAKILKRLSKFNTIPALSKLIRIEKTRLLRPERLSNAGPNGFRYSLATGEMITWPCSARIVLAVWDARGHHISKSVLLTNLEALQLRNDAADMAIDRTEIRRDINEFLIPKGYLSLEGDRLMADRPELTRLKFELEYIYEVAEQCFVGDPPAQELKSKAK
jgi:hypothetical protein